MDSKRFAEAEAIAERALAACTAKSDKLCEAHQLISLADASSRNGDQRKAENALRRARPLVTSLKDTYLEGRFYYSSARVERAAHRLPEAIHLYSQVLSMINLLSHNSPEVLMKNYSFIVDEYIDTLYEATQQKSQDSHRLAAEALAASEMNKSQEFDRLWGNEFAAELQLKLPSNVRDEDISFLSMRAKALAALKQAQTEGAADKIEGAERAVRELDNGEKSFLTMLRRNYPEYAALRYPEPFEITNIPLLDGELLVEARVTDDATFMWYVSKGTDGVGVHAFYRVQQNRAWIESHVQRIKSALDSAVPSNFDPIVCEELFAALFPGHFADDLLRAHSIIFVPDDVLALVPFEMLSPLAAHEKYIFAGLSSRYFPSAESFEFSRLHPRRGSWAHEYLGIGDPITSESDIRYEAVVAATDVSTVLSTNNPKMDPAVQSLQSRGLNLDRLPGTADEVNGTAEIFKSKGQYAETRIGTEATKANLEHTDLSNYRYLHFATHGLLPSQSSLREPALVFSLTPDKNSPLLTMSEVLSLPIQSELTVLSACNSGVGKIERTEGVLNLGRAFMAAGSSSVVVSLWTVADSSTALLMQDFFREILDGVSKDQALSHARVELLKQGFHQPFFWAPFILMGE